MAVDINVVVLVGRLTRDCELKSTPQGTSVCRFSIAVNRRKRTGDRWEDEVSYFDVVLWGKSAELGQSLQKIAGLPAETRIYPGHGEATDLYFEMNNNPYLYQIRHN